MEDIKSYIHGAYIESTSGQHFDSINPASGEVIARVQQADEADVEAAVASAEKGFGVWSDMTGAQRSSILRHAAQLLRDRNAELATLEVRDTGKPIQEALAVDVSSGADAIDYFAGLAPGIHGHHYDLGGPFAYTRREPLGVCVGIGAWNYPIQIACWKSAPALACGNSMIFKPAELTPMSAAKLAEIYSEAGLPDGVFNVVQGDGATGELLTRHPRVAKVSLTGEVGTGKKVMAAAAETLKAVTLELGGKSPLIVFDDADMTNAISAALMANFYTQGEICSNGTRVFVHESIHAPFVEGLRERTEKMRVGDPMDPDTHVGALISEEHMVKILGYIAQGIESGAELVSGGQRIRPEGLEAGYFVEPTIFDACTDDMSIVQEEIFGPVMSILSFTDESDVVERANRTPFGLAAGVFTSDVKRAHRIVAKLQAGTIWINNYNITPIEIPFGGYKQSGIGRENSHAAVEHYTQLKTVYVESGDVDSPY